VIDQTSGSTGKIQSSFVEYSYTHGRVQQHATSSPFDWERSKSGYENILVITDHFTRYAIAIPSRNQTAKTTVEAFLNNFVVHYGLDVDECCFLVGWFLSTYESVAAVGNLRFDIASHTMPYKVIFDE
jgi:hypothetical protein